MLPSFLFYNYITQISKMEGKLKKQDFVKVISQLEVLEKMPRQALEQLCKIFKVEDHLSDLNNMKWQFKNKMADLFCQEAEGYIDYLKLPKFRPLGPEMTERMFTVFASVWQEYHLFKAREQASQAKKQIDELIPPLNTVESLQQFHFKLLQIYRQSPLCPKSLRNEVAESKPISQQDLGNFLFASPVNSINPGMQGPNFYHPMFPFSQTPNYPKEQAPEGIPYIMDNKPDQNHMFDMQRFSMANPSFFLPGQGPKYYPETERPRQVKRQMQAEPITIRKNYFIEEFTTSIQKFKNYQYCQCVCQGRKGHEDTTSFKCTKCQYSYHFSCFRIDNKIQKGVVNNIVCPLCILRKESIFCKVKTQPLKFCWFLDDRGKEFKVELSSQETNEVYQARKNGLDCQMRFLKIDGKSFKKDRRPLNEPAAYTQKINKHSQIPLPQLTQERHQPISLDIVLRTEDDADPSTKLYIFAMFIVNIRSIDCIVKELFESQSYTTQSIYKQILSKEEKVKINLFQQGFNRGQIKLPVRGSDCRHPCKVFDLKIYLDVLAQLKRDGNEVYCPICNQTCKQFKYDKFIYDHIKAFPDYEKKIPEAIIIHKNGQVTWDIAPEMADEQGQQEKSLSYHDDMNDAGQLNRLSDEQQNMQSQEKDQ